MDDKKIFGLIRGFFEHVTLTKDYIEVEREWDWQIEYMIK